MVTKKAACVWLLCITKYCGTTPEVKRLLLSFHEAFSTLLADKDDFTQEIASKGIGLIYDIGDQPLKAQLVQALVSTFTEGKRIAAQSVSHDTQLFSGDIGATPDGGNLNTYQSILSLAADMNQPDLVYKFMSLASHHAIWNSRRGASMGFGSIALQAEKELEPYLPKLVPRLYRYQFDPHPKTAEGMKNIWRSLVKDPVRAVNDHFDQIMAEVLSGMGNRQWRTREACCNALADLLHGRQLEQIQTYMTELWTMCFRAIDDIKESVRKAAFQTCKTLTNLTVRYCDPVYFAPSKSQKIMDDMIPFLLEKGLPNTAEEVRQFSLATILKLCKTGGVLLKPHVSNIICTFLESLSSLEPQAMNYIALNADKYNISQDALEASRLSAAKSSPIMDALDQCVHYVDRDSLLDLVPKLCHIIRKGVGLPTRAGTARFIYTLVQRLPQELKEHADAILKALSGAVFDRSPAVRKSFSTAAGHICKLASPGAVEKLALFLKEKYLDANDEEGRSVAPITYLEISRNAASAAAELHGVILPLAFMGARDTTYPALATIWEKVWEENTGGSTNAIKKWKHELLESLSSVLKTSPSWELKKQCGKGIVDFVKALGPDTVDVLPQLFPTVVDSLSGRTWDGKEALLEAISVIGIEGVGYFATHSEQQIVLEDVLVREARKNNKAYKRVAIEYLGNTFLALKSKRFPDVQDYLLEMARENSPDDMDDIDDSIQKPLVLAIRANAFKAIGQCFPDDAALQRPWIDSVGEFLGSHLVGQVWNIRLQILEGLRVYLAKLATPPSQKCLEAIYHGLAECLSDTKYRSVREATAKTLAQLVATVGGPASIPPACRKSLQDLAGAERDAAIQAALKKALL
ncbi:hypothetical protein HDU91_000683 [Kappamyces sp. JEL0680]|nr:hypothetical protein HDU91_000683 [Kappamyces sp. JEL0680]